MKVQIRHGVFETNSSSTHSLVIMTDEEYKDYMNGEFYLNRNGEKISKDNNRSSKLHLYIPACYKENGSWHTSYILSQLGIKATDEKGKIGLS